MICEKDTLEIAFININQTHDFPRRNDNVICHDIMIFLLSSFLKENNLVSLDLNRHFSLIKMFSSLVEFDHLLSLCNSLPVLSFSFLHLHLQLYLEVIRDISQGEEI